jgi:hypothetical protein
MVREAYDHQRAQEIAKFRSQHGASKGSRENLMPQKGARNAKGNRSDVFVSFRASSRLIFDRIDGHKEAQKTQVGFDGHKRAQRTQKGTDRIFSCLFAAKSPDQIDGHKKAQESQKDRDSNNEWPQKSAKVAKFKWTKHLFVSFRASSRPNLLTRLMATKRRKSHKDKPVPCSPSDKINFFT